MSKQPHPRIGMWQVNICVLYILVLYCTSVKGLFLTPYWYLQFYEHINLRAVPLAVWTSKYLYVVSFIMEVGQRVWLAVGICHRLSIWCYQDHGDAWILSKTMPILCLFPYSSCTCVSVFVPVHVHSMSMIVSASVSVSMSVSVWRYEYLCLTWQVSCKFPRPVRLSVET